MIAKILVNTAKVTNWKPTSIERIQKEPARAVHQQEAQVTPAIMPGVEVRRMTAGVGRQSGRNLGDFHLQQACLHHHLAGEFHAGRADVHAFIALLAEGANAAMEVFAR